MGILEQKIALVTGSARGIGKSIAEELAREGATVIISDVDGNAAAAAAKQMAASGADTRAIPCDVSNADDVEKMMEQVLGEFGNLDILVNNAGITRDNLLMKMSEEEWDDVLRINLKGTFLCTRAVIRSMMRKRSGKIINIASVVGVLGNTGQSNYAASKAGMIAFTKSIAKEVASRNIQVNCVAPGYIATEMTEHLSQEVKDEFMRVTPARRPGHPEEVAKAVVYLASSAADFITGHVLHIDGGMAM